MVNPPVYELVDSSGTVVGYVQQDITNSETIIENSQTSTTLSVKNGEIAVNGSKVGSDTRTDVSELGTTVVAETEDINFTESNAATVSVSDDGDDTVTVDVSATDTNTDTRTDVSDSGSPVVSDTTDIDFDTDLSVSDDGDGSVTVSSSSGGTDKTTTYYHGGLG